MLLRTRITPSEMEEQDLGVEWVTGWMDTPQTGLTTREPVVLKT